MHKYLHLLQCGSILCFKQQKQVKRDMYKSVKVKSFCINIIVRIAVNFR